MFVYLPNSINLTLMSTNSLHKFKSKCQEAALLTFHQLHLILIVLALLLFGVETA